MALHRLFPRLSALPHRLTSRSSAAYNCFAWAAGIDDCWWEPDPLGDNYWPSNAPCERTLEAIVETYGTIGFGVCETSDLNPDFEKIAIYSKDGEATHAARQLPNGSWTSKLGPLEDIEHTLEGLEGAEYGVVARFLRRSREKLPLV